MSWCKAIGCRSIFARWFRWPHRYCWDAGNHDELVEDVTWQPGTETRELDRPDLPWHP